MRDDYGDPDVVEVRQVFNDQLQARKWEHKVLRRMRVVKNSNWLNKTDNKSIDPGCAGSAHRGLTYIQKYGEEKSDKLKQAIAKANQTRERVPWKEKYPGIPFRKTKTPAWNRGVPRTEEEKRKIGGQRAKMKKESIEKMALTKIGRHWYVNTKTGKTSCLFDTDVSDDWKRGRKL
jgi:hypothetical protein